MKRKTPRPPKKLLRLLRGNIVLAAAALCAAASLFLVPPDRGYGNYVNWSVLTVLFCLMAAVAGLAGCGVFARLAGAVTRLTEDGRKLALLLVLACFLISPLITNDVALLTFVPFTAGLFGTDRRLAPTVVMETAAANLGSLLTPIGNPQNLFLYARFRLQPGEFFAVTLPLGGVCLALTALLTWLLVRPGALPAPAAAPRTEKPSLFPLARYGLLFLAGLLTVLRVLPWPVCLGLTLLVLLLFDRPLFGKVDYSLLASFLCFFVLVGNLARLEPVRRLISAALTGRVVLVSALISQVISNVPAAAMLASFTDDWRGLLLGVDIGGLGTLIASMASLISFRLYCASAAPERGRYFGLFSAVNFGLLALLLAGVQLLC